MINAGIEIEHVLARQREETANIALRAVTERGRTYAAIGQGAGLSLPPPESFTDDEGEHDFFSFGSELDGYLA